MEGYKVFTWRDPKTGKYFKFEDRQEYLDAVANSQGKVLPGGMIQNPYMQAMNAPSYNPALPAKPKPVTSQFNPYASRFNKYNKRIKALGGKI